MELERVGKNAEKQIKIPLITYISHGLVSMVCGYIFGLIGMLFKENEMILWLLLGIIGSMLGKKALVIVIRILNNNIEFFKGAISEEEIKEIDKPKEEK